MKTLVLVSAILASASFASLAHADTVYAPNYTCAALQQLVATQGRVGIQMQFGYAVYVSNANRCYDNETVGNGVVFGTRDQAYCSVGYVCDPNDVGGGG